MINLGTRQSIALFSKYNVQHLALYPAQLQAGLMNIVRDQDDRTLLFVLQEIIAISLDYPAPRCRQSMYLTNTCTT